MGFPLFFFFGGGELVGFLFGKYSCWGVCGFVFLEGVFDEVDVFDFFDVAFLVQLDVLEPVKKLRLIFDALAKSFGFLTKSIT